MRKFMMIFSIFLVLIMSLFIVPVREAHAFVIADDIIYAGLIATLFTGAYLSATSTLSYSQDSLQYVYDGMIDKYNSASDDIKASWESATAHVVSSYDATKRYVINIPSNVRDFINSSLVDYSLLTVTTTNELSHITTDLVNIDLEGSVLSDVSLNPYDTYRYAIAKGGDTTRDLLKISIGSGGSVYLYYTAIDRSDKNYVLSSVAKDDNNVPIYSHSLQEAHDIGLRYFAKLFGGISAYYGYKIINTAEDTVVINNDLVQQDIPDTVSLPAPNIIENTDGTTVAIPNTVGRTATGDIAIGLPGVTSVSDQDSVIPQTQTGETTTGATTGATETTLSNVLSTVGAILGAITSFFDFSEPVDWEPIKSVGIGLTNKFPFSLPWDIKNALTVLTVDGALPTFHLQFYNPSGGTPLKFDVNFPSFVADLVPIVRAGALLTFSISLIYSTRRILGGAA